MRVGILTSQELRHRYFVRAVAGEFDVAAVIQQDTGYSPARDHGARLDDRIAAVLARHFDDRQRCEEQFFGRGMADGDARFRHPTLTVSSDELNTPRTLSFLRDASVDVVLVYGTGLVKAPLLSAYSGRMINMHLGLSPYYRGTATNFYPLLNDEPEYVGATIHLLDSGVDSGPIVHHARPEITADDMPHTVGCKAILAGIEKIKLALREFEANMLRAAPQWRPAGARLYLRRDYHPAQVGRLYEMIEAGLFPRYTERKHRVEHAFRLIA